MTDAPTRPGPPVQLMNIGTGTGKSHEAREQAKMIVPQLPEGSCLVIATPTHSLNNEYLEKFRALFTDADITVAVYRGRGAGDPDRPGHKMCDYADEAAELGPAGGDPNQLCSSKDGSKDVRCAFYDECGYREQNNRDPSIWEVPHAVLARKPPKCIGQIAALIIDEDPLNTFFSGFGRPIRVPLDEIDAFRMQTKKSVVGDTVMDAFATADLEAVANKLSHVLRELEGKEAVIPVCALTDAGLTAELMFEARRIILRSKITISVSPDMQPAARREQIEQAVACNRPILRLAQLYKIIGKAITAGFEIVPGCRLEQGIQPKEGPAYDAIRLRGQVELHDDWLVPTMILSATAQFELLKFIWPRLEQVADVHPISPHVYIRQFVWSASNSKMRNGDPKSRFQRIQRYIEVRAFAFRGKGAEIDGRKVDVLVVTQEKFEELFTYLSLPGNVDTAHFNAVEGIDKWGGVACLIVIGRTMPTPKDVELRAEVLTGKVADRGDTEFLNGWYPREAVGIRVKGAGEVGRATVAERHPDKIAEAVRWSICEAGIMQAIGRGRAVNRGAGDPLQIDIISTMPLPLEVDEVLSKEDISPKQPFVNTLIEPDPFMVMAARGLVIDEEATKGKWQVIQKVLSELFETDEAARSALKRSSSNKIYILEDDRLSSFIPASIKIKGARYAVPVWIDADRGEPRKVAETLLGQLDAYEILPVKPDLAEPEPVIYLDPPLEPARPLPPPIEPAPLSLAVANPQPPQVLLPEPGPCEVEPGNEPVPHMGGSYDAIVDWVAGGGIPEVEDYLEASRIWMGTYPKTKVRFTDNYQIQA